MDFSQYHFAQGAWLWGLLAIPIVPLLYSLLFRAQGTELLKRFADLAPRAKTDGAGTCCHIW